jgi:hypothetical protein
MRRLLIAIMYPEHSLLAMSLDYLKKEFGEIFSKSEEYRFDFTDYYEEEFGKNLKKTIVIFKKEINKNDLINIREKTGQIEETLSRSGKRTVNIDPGYISDKELVLATKKNRSFKENLGNGIYAHTVLEFKENKIITFRHTFADYKTETVLNFLQSLF